MLSWCFLQRSDTDGVLDAAYDLVPRLPEKLSAPIGWCKFTIACFRASEIRSMLLDEGHDVRCMLVTRDPRAVYNSLVTKKYGRNGTTAEDPPLRLRLRRYLEDWRLFRERGWPIVRYEDLVAAPETMLREACRASDLPWDDAMMTWPKPVEAIAAADNGNKTFAASRGAGLLASVMPESATVRTNRIPPPEMEWIERELAEMNAALGYAAHLPSTYPNDAPDCVSPTFECTRRHRHEERKHRTARLVQNVSAVVRRAIARTPSRASDSNQPRLATGRETSATL